MRKAESKRTKVEKIARDLAFFGVVLFAASIVYATAIAEFKLAEAEAAYAETMGILVAMNR